MVPPCLCDWFSEKMILGKHENEDTVNDKKHYRKPSPHTGSGEGQMTPGVMVENSVYQL